MKNLDPLSRSKPRELDRKMWADIDRLMYEFQVKGMGEYLSEEPIYFGTAFASPPTLAYSSTTDMDGDEVIPGRFVPPKDYERDVDIYHLGTHSQGMNHPPILDPGFEVQGQWVPMMGDVARRIPTTSEGIGSGYSHYKDWPIYKYWDDGGYEPQNDFHREPNDQFTNCWIQTSEVRGRWSVSDDRSHDYGAGPSGEYSAKFTFVDNGSSTWLIPLGQHYYAAFEPYEEGYVDNPANAHWVYISLGTYALGYYDEEQYRGTDTPPMLNGWDGTAAVWSDDDCELEVWTYNWWYNKDWERSDWVTEPEGGIGDEWWDYPYMPLSYDDPRPLVWGDLWDVGGELPKSGSRDNPVARMGNDVKVKIPIVGGKWNDVSFHLSRERNQWEPNHTSLVSPMLEYETFRFRINDGKPGQVVHFDNAYIWPDLRNIYVPMVTVGVPEWVTDEQGAYIGAKLWIKVGS